MKRNGAASIIILRFCTWKLRNNGCDKAYTINMYILHLLEIGITSNKHDVILQFNNFTKRRTTELKYWPYKCILTLRISQIIIQTTWGHLIPLNQMSNKN